MTKPWYFKVHQALKRNPEIEDGVLLLAGVIGAVVVVATSMRFGEPAHIVEALIILVCGWLLGRVTAQFALDYIRHAAERWLKDY